MANSSSFDRDFGYLMPFLDRVAQAGSGLSPPARAELLRLVAGEKEKFARIRQLLSGAAASGGTRGDLPARPGAEQAARTQTVSERGRELPPRLTVGSLRNEPIAGGNPRLNRKTPY
ncbi:MAG: hypothetical protein ACJ790_07710 [Myxococcaceae bacterium]